MIQQALTFLFVLLLGMVLVLGAQWLLRKYVNPHHNCPPVQTRTYGG